jgi:hypothetical protein
MASQHFNRKMFRLLDLCAVNEIRFAETHTAESLLTEAAVATEKLQSHRSAGIDQNPTELIQVESKILSPVMNKLSTSIWNMEQQWKESVIYICL